MIDHGWYLWLVVAGMAVVTITNRAGMILLADVIKLPPVIQKALRYAPAAALAAIAVPELFVSGGQLDLSIHNVKLIAGIAGFTIAMVWRSTVPAIIGGMLALHALQWLMR